MKEYILFLLLAVVLAVVPSLDAGQEDNEKSEGVHRKLQFIEDKMKTMTQMMNEISAQVEVLKEQSTAMPDRTGSQPKPREAVDKEIFLSYEHETKILPFVTRLKSDLEKRGFRVWLNLNDLSAGSDWHGVIGTALDRCKALIAVITHKYTTSTYCRNELYFAEKKGKKLFPVIYEDIDFTSSERAQGVDWAICSIHQTMFRPGKDDYDTALEQLVKGLEQDHSP